MPSSLSRFERTCVLEVPGRAASGKGIWRQEVGQLLHARRIGSRGVQDGAAIAIDGTRIGTIEGPDIVIAALGVVQIDVRQSFPATPDAKHFEAVFRASVNGFFDDRVQPRNITAAGEDSNALAHNAFSRVSPRRCTIFNEAN